MNLNVSLAGVLRSWRFPGSAALDDWLLTRPWLGAGGVRVLRVTAGRDSDDVARAVRRCVLAYDEGSTEVRVKLLPRSIRTPFPVLAGQVLGLPELTPDGLSRREYLAEAGKVLARRPMVLVFGLGQGDLDPSFLDGAEQFVEDVGKGGGGPTATVLLIDSPAAPLGGDAYDFTSGMPADSILTNLLDDEPTLWRSYVHARLAWETAGDVARALAWDQDGFADLAPGQDEALEMTLNESSSRAFEALERPTQESVLSCLRLMVARRQRSKELEMVAQLLARGVFWRPPGEGRPRPAPWMARALLVRQQADDARYLLRGCLLCAPLARELLNRCFDLEAQERALCWMERGTAKLPPDICQKYDKFVAADVQSEYEFYPPGSPAAPTDEWPFATFGELLHNLKRKPKTHAYQFDLRDLRNALAHGHYVSWHALTLLRRIERQVDR